MLLGAKADATLQTERTGLNALHYACSDQVVAYLRDAGASVNDKGREDVSTAFLQSSAQAFMQHSAAAAQEGTSDNWPIEVHSSIEDEP